MDPRVNLAVSTHVENMEDVMMRKFLPFVAVVVFLMLASPVWAFDFDFNFETNGRLSIGLGGGFGDERVGPGVLSAKYVDNFLEVGIEGLYDGDTEDQNDALALGWLLYRYNLYEEDRNTPYFGLGIGRTYMAQSYENGFGIISAMGWDTNFWGLELKWGYFDPSLYTFVAYYHFK